MKTYVSKRTKFTKNSISISTLYAETLKKNFFTSTFAYFCQIMLQREKTQKTIFLHLVLF